MRLPIRTRTLLAAAVVGVIAFTTPAAFSQDGAGQQQQEEQAARERAREEAAQRLREAERARAEAERAYREAERAAQAAAAERAQRAAQEQERGAREGERAAREAERAARAEEERVLRVPRVWRGEDNVFRLRPAQIETKPQTYLGVSTGQLTPEVAAQVGELPQGVGLVVGFVDEEGPAGKAGLQAHDVLVKMNDQWLVNPAQLTVLIRMHQKGEKASFTVMRKGQEQQIEVELGEKELPVVQAPAGVEVIPMAPMAPMPPGRLFGELAPGFQGVIDPAQMEEINRRVQEAMKDIELQLELQMKDLDMPEMELRMEELREQLLRRNAELERLGRDAPALLQRGLSRGGRLMMTNDDMTLRMVNEDGQINILVQDGDGETVYEGPYPDEEALGELPPEAQEIIRQAKQYLPGEGEAQPARPTPAAPAAPAPQGQGRQRESIPI